MNKNNLYKYYSPGDFLLILVIACFPAIGMSVEDQPAKISAVESTDSVEDIVKFPADFFSKYQPNTALDIVEQVPGFRIDNGSGQRGFGGASGNVLINGRRPTAKQDQPSDILDRIPAEKVGRVEIIRGDSPDFELQGQVEVVNVILKPGEEGTIRWEANIGKQQSIDTIPVNGNISLANQWQDVKYNMGLEANRFVRPDSGTESITDASDELVRNTRDSKLADGYRVVGNMNGATEIMDTIIHFNTELGYRNVDDEFSSMYAEDETSTSVPYELLLENRQRYQLEVGVDFERELIKDLSGKYILLYTRAGDNDQDNQRRYDDAGELLRTRAKNVDKMESELIARSEFYWTGWEGHSPKFSMEFAYNLLDNNEIETRDLGNGPVTVPVPGANTRVQETRGDFMLNESWMMSGLELEFGLGSEVSQIKQNGDANLSRGFFFFKPSMMLSYVTDDTRQTRIRLERRVGQLDFDDFVSSTIFEDDEVSPGNPNLSPETSWAGEVSYEQRFMEVGVVKLTAFHHWISDVVDLLPLTDTEETPGNIGSGKRWGVLFESSVPMDYVGIDNSRLDIELYWQDSTVVDPVTGNPRQLSSTGGDYFNRNSFNGDVEYQVNVGFRQDLLASRSAWGWAMSFNADRTRFKVNELETRDDGMDLNLFAETSRWLGLKFRVDAKNLLNSAETRNRKIYQQLRGLSALDRNEFRSYTQGREIELTVSGTF